MFKNKDEEEEVQEPKPYEYFEQKIQQSVHHYYLSWYVSQPTDYVKMIHEILHAGPEEVVHIHLNTGGGDLSTGVQLINAMKATQATVICSLEAEAHSLGSLIFLAADQFIVHENSLMLIHNMTGGVYGKGKESALQMEATLKWFQMLARKYYVPFLTEKELEGVLDDKDMWLHTDDIRRRLNKMIKIKRREMKQAEEG